MELFEIGMPSVKDVTCFIKHVCQRFGTTPEEIHDRLTSDLIAGNVDSPLCQGIKSLFRYDCLCDLVVPQFEQSNHYLFTMLFSHLIARSTGIDELLCALKKYDYSERCSLVWISDYFAYRCRTCGLSPNMALCGACFTSGNHENHDFNKFKSTFGGACDCGDPSIIRASGNCCFHGPDKIANISRLPKDLIAVLEFLIPNVIKALIYWLWDRCKVEEPDLSETEVPMLCLLRRLHACGWVSRQMMVDVMLDPRIYEELLKECAFTSACRSYKASVAAKPRFSMEDDADNEDEDSQNLKHTTLLESFLFIIVKLRFPESLSSLLIGLLAVTEAKERFVNTYVDHYPRIASTLITASHIKRISPAVAKQLNNQIIRMSAQLFSSVDHACRMLKEKSFHYLIVEWMRNMFALSHTRVDDRGNRVVNCSSVLFQNNAFWPLIVDLRVIFSHKVASDVLIEDRTFLSLWTDILKFMQFMNCISMKEGNHRAWYYGLTMESELSISIMWCIWDHYRAPSEKEHCLMYTRACIEPLVSQLTHLGRLVPSTSQEAHPIRGPLSLHLPLCRHSACFLGLSVFTHAASLKTLMAPFLGPSPNALRRLMEELANVLLGCHEVLIGYWTRNGQPVRKPVLCYMDRFLCHSTIDLDIFLFQVCATLMHPVHILNALVDQSRLLKNVCFHRELMALTRSSLVSSTVDRPSMAIEAWLTNLCWILDLRNNLDLSERDLLEKELMCFLAPNSRKRSGLSCLMPQRCLLENSDLIDECLKKIATYSAPSCNSMSGSLLSGHYSLKPERWNDTLDPVFYSLRITSKCERALVLERYRQHCRQTEGAFNTSALWPPYRLPIGLLADFADLENSLHSRHLHYLLFALLSLYVYGDPLMTEESLVMVIHLLYRAVVAGDVILKEGLKSNFINVEMEPAIPKFKQVQCTEAFMTTSNREAELGVMQFAVVDSTAEGEQEAGDYLEQMTENEVDRTNNDATLAETEDPLRVQSNIASFNNSSTQSSNASEVRRPLVPPFKWDLSIIACPYPVPQSKPTIFQNLPTWLATGQHAVSVLNGTECSSPLRDESYTLIDSLLSLLVKAHARLNLSRVAAATDPMRTSAAVMSQEHVFLTLPILFPSQTDATLTSACTKDLNARCMAVLNATNTEESVERGSTASPLAHALQADISSGTPEEKMIKVLTEMAPELRYFALAPPAYKLPEEKEVEGGNFLSQLEKGSTLLATQNAKLAGCGDGVYWVGKLLDKIVELSSSCQSHLKEFLDRSNNPFQLSPESETSIKESESAVLPPVLQSITNARDQRKRAASERRKRLLDMMASRQRAFTDNFLKDIDMGKLCVETAETLGSKMERKYDCVICHAIPETPQPMVMLVMFCESRLTGNMRNYCELPYLDGERMVYSRNHLCEDICIPRPLPLLPPELRRQMEVAPKLRASSILCTEEKVDCGSLITDTIFIPSNIMDSTAFSEASRCDGLQPVAYAENRRWWHLALPVDISSSLPLLKSGLLLQTCGHAVHLECFQQYRFQIMHGGGVGVNRWFASCPQCRRDVHLLLPIHRDYDPKIPDSLNPPSHKTLSGNDSALGAEEKELAAGTATSVFAEAPSPQVTASSKAEIFSSLSSNSKTFDHYLRKRLKALPTESHSFWNDLVVTGEEDSQNRYGLIADLFGDVSEVAILLRLQFESELSILMAYPELYQGVARRFPFREMMNYLRHIYRSPADLLLLVDSLTLDSVSDSNLAHLTNSHIPLTFAICNDPADALMTLLPHVWPNEDAFLKFGSACICLAYARVLVGFVLGQRPTDDSGFIIHSRSASIHCAQECMPLIASPLRGHVLAVIACLEQLLDRAVVSGEEGIAVPDLHNDTSAASTTFSTIASCENVTWDLEFAASLDVPQLTSASSPREAGQQLQDYVVARLLPTLRLVALCLARWHDSLHVHDEDFPKTAVTPSLPFVGILANPRKTDLEKGQRGKEFEALMAFIGVDFPHPDAGKVTGDSLLGVDPLLPSLKSAAVRSGLTTSADGARALDELLHRWINQVASAAASEKASKVFPDALTAANGFDDCSPPTPPPALPLSSFPRHALKPVYRRSSQYRSPHEIFGGIGFKVNLADWVQNLGPLMAIGCQLYPPRLIRPPEAFDDLFNSLQVVNCAASRHPFQKNVLCLICGQVVCGICFTNLAELLFNHSYQCDGFVGVGLEISTSLVHVSLGMSSCEWGSMYLDVFGEEDIGLKRGKPIFLNEERFTLLESQWMSHSFRYVLKHWHHY